MKKLLIVLSLMISANAFAGILFEPYLGYHLAGTEQTGSTDADVTGVGYGARVGWTLPLVFFALDYSAASLDIKADDGTPKLDGDYTALGAVVGASLPIFRLWAGYNFSSQMDIEGQGKAKGNGMKAGLGFKMPVLPISFNLEYIINQYDKLGSISLTNDLKQKGIFFSVSAPLSF